MHHCITDKTKASHSFSWKLKSPSSAISQASLWCQKIIMTNSFLNSNNTSLAKTFFSSYFHLFFPVPIFSQIIYPGICAKSHFHPNNFSNKGNCVFWQPHLMRQMPWMQSFFVILSPSSPAYSYIKLTAKRAGKDMIFLARHILSWEGYMICRQSVIKIISKVTWSWQPHIVIFTEHCGWNVN